MRRPVPRATFASCIGGVLLMALAACSSGTDGQGAPGQTSPARPAVAASADLAYTLGGAESARARGVDVRVWRFEGGAWKLLAEVTAAVK